MSLINPSIKEILTAAQKDNNSITASALMPSTELNIQRVLKYKKEVMAQDELNYKKGHP